MVGFLNYILNKLKIIVLGPNKKEPTNTIAINFLERNPSTLRITGSTENQVFHTNNGLYYRNSSFLNPAPLLHFIKKFFPFVEGVTTISSDPNIGGGHILRIYITLSATHFSETFIDSNVEKKLINVLEERLAPLITCMYTDIQVKGIQYIFSPKPTNTLNTLLNGY
jgi:hypothetical protein